MSAFAADEVTGAGTFDFARTEGGGTDDTLRNLRAALVLGWRVESNWTDPLLFFIYTVARPIASLCSCPHERTLSRTQPPQSILLPDQTAIANSAIGRPLNRLG